MWADVTKLKGGGRREGRKGAQMVRLNNMPRACGEERPPFKFYGENISKSCLILPCAQDPQLFGAKAQPLRNGRPKTLFAFHFEILPRSVWVRSVKFASSYFF